MLVTKTEGRRRPKTWGDGTGSIYAKLKVPEEVRTVMPEKLKVAMVVTAAISFLAAGAGQCAEADKSSWDPEDFLRASEGIYICQFRNYEIKGSVTYQNPPCAYFHIIEHKMGPPISVTMPIRYDFGVKPGEPTPKGWKFDEGLMPKKDSRWIIFLRTIAPLNGMFETYKGSAGRVEATEENLDLLEKVIEKHRGTLK